MVAVLDREMYTEAEAARLLRVPPSTLHYWLEGGERRGRVYRPIVREEPKQVRTVTWAEFIEAGWLSEYRRRQVPMLELRKFIDVLRAEFGVPYPLADRRPLVSGRQLVYDAQTAARLGAEFCLISIVNNQYILTPPGHSFAQRVEWIDDQPAAYLADPAAGSPVRIDPEVRFGRPSIKGVSTEAVWEQAEAGEGVEEIAEVFQLQVSDVRWALAYENVQHAA